MLAPFSCQNSPELCRHGFHQIPEGVMWYLAPWYLQQKVLKAGASTDLTCPAHQQVLDWMQSWVVWRPSQHLICNKLSYSLYSGTFLSEPALTSSAIWATVARLLDQTTQASLHSPLVSTGHDPVTMPTLLRHGLGTPHNSCSKGDGLTQSSSPAVPNPRAADPNPDPGARMKRWSVLLPWS